MKLNSVIDAVFLINNQCVIAWPNILHDISTAYWNTIT